MPTIQTIEYPVKKFSDVVTDLGLTTNLKLVLDAGDSASYSAGQSWLDRSGNGYDFFLGATVGAEASDPTFNGVAGAISSAEYFSTDAGDWFTYDTASETWMNNIHKDNAIFTLAAWVYYTARTGEFAGSADPNVDSGPGFYWHPNSNNRFRALIDAGAGTVALNITQTTTFPINEWAFVAVSLNEATGASGAILVTNSTAETFTSTYTTPSASAASRPMQILARGNGSDPAPNGSRIAGYFAWEGTALTEVQLRAFYEATRTRFGV